jgi:hypothetical protein
MQNTGQDTVQNAWITIPPLGEEKKVSSQVCDIREKTARMEEALRNSVDLLRERRAALITAAVTGQIHLEAMRPVPLADIERRFPRSLRHLLDDFCPRVDRCTCFMNDGESPVLVFEQWGEDRSVVHGEYYQHLIDEAQR